MAAGSAAGLAAGSAAGSAVGSAAGSAVLMQTRQKHCINTWSPDKDGVTCDPNLILHEARICDSEFETMRCLGTDDYCCTENTPCDKNEGDCDSDSQCKDGLICGENNCKSEWKGLMEFDDGDDCCKDAGNKVSHYRVYERRVRIWGF